MRRQILLTALSYYLDHFITIFPIDNMMYPELECIFKEYETLLAEADAIFSYISSKYPDCVKCREGCSDCCSALFDLSLVEAMHINREFEKNFDYGRTRSNILERASKTDRSLARIKKDLFRSEKDGQDIGSIMENVAAMRMPCPLLNEDNKCYLYVSRPITCRLYGIPIEIDGKSHVCGLANFDKGKSYPTVKLAKIQKRVEDLSKKIAEAISSPFDMADVYVPLSMALLTKYDDKYFGKEKDDE